MTPQAKGPSTDADRECYDFSIVWRFNPTSQTLTALTDSTATITLPPKQSAVLLALTRHHALLAPQRSVLNPQSACHQSVGALCDDLAQTCNTNEKGIKNAVSEVNGLFRSRPPQLITSTGAKPTLTYWLAVSALNRVEPSTHQERGAPSPDQPSADAGPPPAPAEASPRAARTRIWASPPVVGAFALALLLIWLAFQQLFAPGVDSDRGGSTDTVTTLNAANQSALGMLAQLAAQADPYEIPSANPRVSLKDAFTAVASAKDQSEAGADPAGAELHKVLAKVFESLGDYPEASEQARREVLARERLPEGGSAELVAARERYCRYTILAGNLASSAAACDALQVADDASAEPGRRPETQIALAQWDYESGRCQSAITRLDPLVSTPAPTPAPDWYADARWFHALCASWLGDMPTARAGFLQLRQLQQKTHGPGSPWTAWALSDDADSQVDQGDTDTAIALANQALSIFSSTLGSGHVDTAEARYVLGRALLRSGKYQQALPHLEEAHTALEAGLVADHSWTLHAAGDLAWAQALNGTLGDLGGRISQLVTRAERAYPNAPQRLAILREVWVRALIASGDLAAAQRHLTQLTREAADSLPPNHWVARSAECLRTLIRDPAPADRSGSPLSLRCLAPDYVRPTSE